jgi:hypothetical protein
LQQAASVLRSLNYLEAFGLIESEFARISAPAEG